MIRKSLMSKGGALTFNVYHKGGHFLFGQGIRRNKKQRRNTRPSKSYPIKNISFFSFSGWGFHVVIY